MKSLKELHQLNASEDRQVEAALPQIYIDEACADQISSAHLEEWTVGSAVDLEIVRRNVETLRDTQIDVLSREVDHPIAEKLNWKISHGYRLHENLQGWWVSGVDPLNNYQRMEWGRFKPDADTPVIERRNKKPAKYLSPSSQASRIVLLDVPISIWQKVSERYGIAISTKATFWQWVWLNNVPIVLCEGEKKAGCLLTLGYAAISLPGITTGCRRDEFDNFHLIPELQHFATKDREVYICFDYETKEKTIAAIRRETYKLKVEFSKAKSLPKIITLPGPEKGVDDFVVARGAESFQRCYETALDYRRWERQRYSRLTYSPHLEINQRYLGKLPIPENAKLIALKSAKGTGKTESFLEIVDQAMQTGQRVLLITHRVQLGQAIADRIGIPYVTELRTEATGDLLGYGVCVDSLHPESQARFRAEQWHNEIVILDECEQVIWHTLSAETEVKNRRCRILGEIRQLLINTLNSDYGKVVLSDADLSDLSIRFVAGLGGFEHPAALRWLNPFIVVNAWKPEVAPKIYHYPQSNPLACFAALVEEVAADGKVFVTTQSQKVKSKWSTRTMEAVLRSQFPAKKILRIDSQTIADPEHAAYGCLGNLDQVLAEFDVVLASPSIETGVSIDLKGHFTAVFGFFQGVSPENSARQALARVREAVPRHIWIAKRGVGSIGNGATTLNSLLQSQKEVARLTGKLLTIGIDPDSDELTNPTAFNIWGKMACRINAGMASYREAVVEGLIAEGCEIIEVFGGGGHDELDEQIVEIRNDEHQAECEAIAYAPDITDKEAEKLQEKKNKTICDVLKQRKHFLKQRYQVEVTPELVAKDDNKWYPQIRLHYYLTVGKQFVESRDRQLIQTAIETKETWLPTLTRSTIGLQVEILERLGIHKLLNPSESYHKAHPDLIHMAELAKKNRWQIKAGLGITINEKDSPIAIAQILLKKIGQRLTYLGRLGSRGIRERIYQFTEAEDDRMSVFVQWLKRDTERANQPVSTPGLNNNFNGWTPGGQAA